MVISKINKSINYPERKGLYVKDNAREVELYKMIVNDVDSLIAIGSSQTLEELIFFPIYLVNRDRKVVQIGLYETRSGETMATSDIIKREPLLFGFVNKKFLLENRIVPSEFQIEEIDMNTMVIEDAVELDRDAVELKEVVDAVELKEEKVDELEEEEEPQCKDDPEKPRVFTICVNKQPLCILIEGAAIPPTLKEETVADMNTEYVKKSSDYWVNKFAKSDNYSFSVTETNGDCFFASIRNALANIAQQTSVGKLRALLAQEATPELFQNYLEQFEMYAKELDANNKQIAEWDKELVVLNSRFAAVNDRDARLQVTAQIDELTKKRSQLDHERSMTKTLLEEFTFMKGINSIDKFKMVLKRSEYWADTWAISTLERLLNIKFIILSGDAYKQKDLSGVLRCGQLNDTVLETKGVFEPDFYIMVDHAKKHYQTIGYKQKFIFTFAEVPYFMKKLVVEKCMEKDAGVFALIPDFKQFKESLALKVPVPSVGLKPSVLGLNPEVRYDDDIHLVFHSKSSTALPGKGTSEKLSDKSKLKEFSVLATIPLWRRKLSDEWINPDNMPIEQFKLDGHAWASVEHYLLASKFKGSKDLYNKFSLDVDSEIGKDLSAAKRFAKDNRTSVDPKYDKKAATIAALQAKFGQNDEFKKLLLATNKAKLSYFVKESEPVAYEELMSVRDQLQP
jgi:predicted NAD-dependent protein-ADP-ribosyltransferase YbiA (DUF1768 family)